MRSKRASTTRACHWHSRSRGCSGGRSRRFSSRTEGRRGGGFVDKVFKRYARAMWLPTTVLLLVVMAFGLLQRHLPPVGKAIGVAVLMAGYGWVGWAEFRHTRGMDEMRRQIE